VIFSLVCIPVYVCGSNKSESSQALYAYCTYNCTCNCKMAWKKCIFYLFIYCSALYICQIRANGSGANINACNTMVPGHPGNPQTTSVPYKLDIDHVLVDAGSTVTLVLKSISGSETFKGFMVKATSNYAPIGNFIFSAAE
jgi:hypothetical protein